MKPAPFISATSLGSALALLILTQTVHAAARLEVQADKPGARIHPAMWGVFFEDINYGADGGLYAELVKNRSFEFAEPLMGWKVSAAAPSGPAAAVNAESPANPAQPNYLRVILPQEGGRLEVVNEGFFGMGLQEGDAYLFSAQARVRSGTDVQVDIELITADGRRLAGSRIKGFNDQWTLHRATLRPTQTEEKARLRLVISGKGGIDLDMVSLFPRKTWKGRSNGLRADLVQMLADLRPGFVRFPGGCIVEGRYLTNRYQWKNTIGAPGDRRVIVNRWNNEFKHRPAPDYFQSFGLGFYEYFLMCEDIGAEPLPILNCGMACQFNSGELVPTAELDPYIQDALDLIEFANGPATSPWGRKRAEMGHPKPFGLKMLGVGNEQWGPQYVERYQLFAAKLKASHPEIALIASVGPDPDGAKFDLLWNAWRQQNPDIVDEHYYRPPGWFFQNTHRYDDYPRTGPKIFAGEYAAQSVRTVSPENRNNLECALSEAAMMTGYERNADVVRLASYAPLFAHTEGWQWRPNLIWFGNLRVHGTPNYYVQQLFARNRGDAVLPVTLQGEGKDALFASAACEDSGAIILKVVNRSASPTPVDLHIRGTGGLKPKGTVTVLAAASLQDENSLDQPTKIAPVTEKLRVPAPEFQYQFAPYSLTVLRLSR